MEMRLNKIGIKLRILLLNIKLDWIALKMKFKKKKTQEK